MFILVFGTTLCVCTQRVDSLKVFAPTRSNVSLESAQQSRLHDCVPQTTSVKCVEVQTFGFRLCVAEKERLCSVKNTEQRKVQITVCSQQHSHKVTQHIQVRHRNGLVTLLLYSEMQQIISGSLVYCD